MRNFYRILRTFLVTLLLLSAAVPVTLYILLSLPGVQKTLSSRAEQELTRLLGTPVDIGSVSFAPFNRVTLRDVTVTDMRGDTALAVGHLGAGISFIESIWNKRPVITYAEIIDLHMKLTRDSAGAPLNIDPIIARFRKKESKGPSAFDLSVNMVVIRRSSLTYDVIEAPARENGHFDPSHIAVSDLRADLRAPRISDGRMEVEIKRFGAMEQSGLTVTDLSASLSANRHEASVNNLSVSLPASKVSFDRISFPSPLSAGFDPRTITTRVATLPGSQICAADLSPFLPVLSVLHDPVDVEIDLEGGPAHIDIHRLSLTIGSKNTWLQAEGSVDDIDKGRDGISIDLSRLSINVSLPAVIDFLSRPDAPGHGIHEKLNRLSPLGEVNLLGSVGADASRLDFNGSLLTDCGNIDLDCGISRRDSSSPLAVDGYAGMENFDPSGIVPALADLEDITLESRADLTIAGGGRIDGIAECNISQLTWRGEQFKSIMAAAQFAASHVDFDFTSTSAPLDLSITGGHDLKGDNRATEVYADVRNIDLSTFLRPGNKMHGASLSGRLDASVHGTKPDDITGWLRLNDLRLKSADGNELAINDIQIEAEQADDSLRMLSLRSPLADIDLNGRYTYASLARTVENTIARSLPSLMPGREASPIAGTEADLAVTIHTDTTISRFLKLPVEFIYPVNLKMETRGSDLYTSLSLNAPYLRNKDKLIENTSLSVVLDGPNNRSTVEAGSTIPTKNGPMKLTVNSIGHADSIRSGIYWKVDRAKDFRGKLLFSTLLDRLPDGQMDTRVKFHPSQLVFNDSAWTVDPGVINIRPGRITVDNFGGHRNGQRLEINGVASADSTDRLTVNLDHIDLDYIFETLSISDAVVFGGRATGKFHGERLLSKAPVLYTPRLFVKDLSYNHCVMGDGDIRSWWDNSSKRIIIDADISGKDGDKSLIDGFINPLTEELDFNFKASRAPVEFMLPFMAAFTSDISGHVSGNARLSGTFKDLDMTGDIFADNLGLKLDFTNTVYHVTDSVHLRPGRISFNDVDLTDMYGNHAKLSGEVGHTCFHDPTFRFEITDVSNMLVYDVSANDTEDPWYGRIFGRGKATVTGVPGFIDINVAMTTEPKTTFSFVLDDRESSAEYDFITFRDRDKARKDSLAALDPTPVIVRQLRDRIRKQTASSPSIYRMEFNVDVTPTATLNLIMDPVGGDKITAHGSGHITMSYDSSGELEMWGKYVLSRGSYNFTLQDIVVKDFTIREGSSIEFRGDPYSAVLDITASYSTTANLSDLDESFLNDPELNRTNVRVNALLKAKGDMRQPEIGFDLEFPSLTADTYRKVRSIVSTEDMMDRQIIYLLALNRFYTPDYMDATHGSELMSVATSTLSSRLGSMLGQLSDNWSIAPAIRSDRSDFSNVEVDVALTSHLLDNRLLFNGNLGYRDKSLNNNSFIGDFDIRYLLNRAGTFQLKAYNRYNDQNYYLKSALTTQGIGIVLKREFDNLFDLFHRRKKPTTEPQP